MQPGTIAGGVGNTVKARKPGKGTLEYVKLLLEVVLLMLALPLALWHIRNHPKQAAERAWGRGGA